MSQSSSTTSLQELYRNSLFAPILLGRCTIEVIHTSLRIKNHNLKKLISSLVRSSSFRDTGSTSTTSY
jgi:hypothetical protein